MQVVRHELVVALEIVIGNVEEDGPILAFGALAQDFNGQLMPFEQRRQERDEGLFKTWASDFVASSGMSLG